jgi:hypothetical protein
MVDVGASRSVPEGSSDIIAGAGSIAELLTSVIAAESGRRAGKTLRFQFRHPRTRPVHPKPASADIQGRRRVGALLEIGSIVLLSRFGGNYV